MLLHVLICEITIQYLGDWVGPEAFESWVFFDTLVHKNKYDFTFYYSLIQNNILAEGLPSAAQDFENILSVELGIVRSNFT